ncbi:hypothetical protein J3E69DRAFT_202685 [Trichoderma sp. SZMC 28015]
MTAPTKDVGGWSWLARICPVTAARCLLGRAACISNLGAFSCEQRGNEKTREDSDGKIPWVDRIEAISRRECGGCNPLRSGCSRYRIRTSPALDVCRTNMQRTLAAPCLAPSRQLVHVPASSTQPARYRVLELGARGSTWSEGLRTNQSPSPGFNCLPVRTRTRCSAPFHVLLGSTSPFSVLGSLFHFPFPSILSHPPQYSSLSTSPADDRNTSHYRTRGRVSLILRHHRTF